MRSPEKVFDMDIPNVKKIKINKKIILTAAIIIIAAAVIYLCLYKVEYCVQIDKTVTALMMNAFDTDITEVDIKIKGEYVRTVMGKDGRFNGEQFSIEGFENTRQISWCSFYLDGGYPGFINYSYYRSTIYGGYDFEFFGNIYSDNHLKSFIIVPYKKPDAEYVSYINEKSDIICYPAATREDAVKLINDMAYVREYFKDIK